MADKQKNPSCDHKGHYKSAGVIPITTRDGINIMTILYCENCGAVMGKDFKITSIPVAQRGGMPVKTPLDLSKRRRN